MARPQNIGIKAIELYFPNQCVDQTELEKFDGVSAGKYTIGLGQTKMSFCDDREDIYSITLTTVSSLLSKYNIDPSSIGRLEVGTETLLDKSKSVKTVLMQLFEASGNTNVEGVDTVNACYGGTNALFNTLNWMESSSWDGRDGIVVAGDIALYQKGNARPTGGAGCVAMLIGPDAPLAFEPGLRGSYVKHAYDFYKPDLTSEYPIVDGQFSLRCYTEAVDACYKAYNEREKKLLSHANGTNGTNGVSNGVNGTNGVSNGVNGVNGTNGTHEKEEELPIDRFNYMVFHAPTCKLVAKSYARLLYNDYLNNRHHPLFESADIPHDHFATLSPAASTTDKQVEKTFMQLAKKRTAQRLEPGIHVPTMCGNMYCASVYSALVSLISRVPDEQFVGSRVGIFSYGSGLASSMFSLRVRGSCEELRKSVDLENRLQERNTVDPRVYDEMCELRHKAHLQKNYTPQGPTENLRKGTWYLTSVDDMYRRQYAIKE